MAAQVIELLPLVGERPGRPGSAVLELALAVVPPLSAMMR
jgi:hypothetical protein